MQPEIHLGPLTLQSFGLMLGLVFVVAGLFAARYLKELGLAYHYNLLCAEPGHELSTRRQRMMAMLAKHLALFVSGKMQVEGLGEFCCSSRPLRQESAS